MSTTTYTLEEFKSKFKNMAKPNEKDFVDIKHGRMIIHKCNINLYLEKYACKDEEDLSDTLWYSYGCLVKIID